VCDIIYVQVLIHIPKEYSEEQHGTKKDDKQLTIRSQFPAFMPFT